MTEIDSGKENMVSSSAFHIHQGDSVTVLRTLPDASVHCCITSPPYYGLRDYGVDGQIGLEPTPDAYIARLVEVFREVRRVLRDHGTLFVNIGDSYAATTKGSSGKGEKQVSNAGTLLEDRRWRVPVGLKPKDLIGIPWMLAFALRAPYYTGRIKREQDRIWLAAMMDGEGCFYIHRRKAGQHAGDGYYRQNDSFSPAFEVANTSERIIDRCMEIAGCGSITRQDKDRRRPLYRWTVRCDEARQIARELHPYLVAKQQQSRIVYGLPPNGPRAAAGWDALKSLHAGIASDVDFPVPPTCHEPGFYLRQDCIWSKPNPMPESVKDRCTKAHEYIFMLSKSARYWWDADAVKEPASDTGRINGRDGRSEPTEARPPASNPRTLKRLDYSELGRNKRSVWTLATLPTPDAHFATFPIELPETCLKAGCPEGGVVLDPFAGAGTTGLACLKNGRRFVGIELNPSYIEIAMNRARRHYPLLLEAAS